MVTVLRLSVIIPALNEERGIGEVVADTQRGLGVGDELIVVDGGSVDGTRETAQAAGARVVASERGRGLQMNRGAELASGDVLLFLHADTRLPVGFRDGIVAALELGVGEPGWGRFDLRFDEAGPALRLIAWLINHRSRWTGGATGDQALFVRQSVFRELGGYNEPLLFEDVDICRRLRSASTMAIPTGRVTTSSRRWRNSGTWRTTFLMWGLKLAYLAGVPSSRLAARYDDSR